MKTYAPKGLHGAQLRPLMAELFTNAVELSRFLRVTERTVWRWLSEDSCPWHILALLWHETEAGRVACSLDVGNALVLARGLGSSHAQAHAAESARLARLVAISDTGAANDPLLTGPHAPLLPDGLVVESGVAYRGRGRCRDGDGVSRPCVFNGLDGGRCQDGDVVGAARDG